MENVVRIAEGRELKGWQPGTPLRRGRRVSVDRVIAERGCPWTARGLSCRWCVNGHRWNGFEHEKPERRNGTR
jgi:hypothetical protein